MYLAFPESLLDLRENIIRNHGTNSDVRREFLAVKPAPILIGYQSVDGAVNIIIEVYHRLLVCYSNVGNTTITVEIIKSVENQCEWSFPHGHLSQFFGYLVDIRL